MSSSSTAMSAAWTVLKNDDPDKVEKLLPLIPLAMAGYGAYRGYKNVTNEGGPVVTDPLTGGYLYENKVDPTLGGYASAFGSGALEGVGMGGLAKVGAKGVGKIAGRSALNRGAARQAAAQQARKETTERLARQEADRALPALRQHAQDLPGQMSVYAPSGRALDDMAMNSARNSKFVTGQATGAARTAGDKGRFMHAATGKVDDAAKRLDMALTPRAFAYGGLGALAAGAGGAFLVNQGINQLDDASDPNTSGFGNHAGASSFGSGQYGMGAQGAGAGGFGMDTGIGGVGNQNSNLTDRQDIWSGTENTGQFNQQVAKGENMKIGERMLKQAENMMYKKVCPKCGKADCKCDDKKKTENCPNCGKVSKQCGCGKGYGGDMHKGKKPSHGMVIVIGSKAGPGPPTDGKRDKLDSDKDKKEE